MDTEQGRPAFLIMAALLAAFVVAACGGSQPLDGGAAGGSAKDEGSGQSSGSGSGGSATTGSNASTGDTLGGGCKVVSTTALGWTEQTELGTPSEVFGALGGSCEAPFQWDGSGWSDMATVDPVTGQSTLSVTVEIDEGSARLVRMEPEDSTLLVLCGSTLEVDAEVTLELAEGPIVRAEPMTISVYDSSTSPRITFSLAQGEFGDWVSVETESASAEVSMSVEMMPVGQACAGSMGLSVQVSQGGMGTGAGQLGFATWSDTDCGVGQFPVNLEEPFRDVDVGKLVEDTFDQHEFPVTWRTDNTETVLTLEVSVAEQQVCAEDNGGIVVVQVPIDIVASTADARVDLAGRGTARVIMADGVVTGIELWMSADYACDSETDTLPYQAVDCSSTDRMTAQLGVNYAPGDDTYTTGELLFLYIHSRENTAPPGGFDRADELALTE